MTPYELIRAAGAAGLDLGTRNGRLILESRTGHPPQDLLAAITVHKLAIVACLEEYAGSIERREAYVQQVAQLSVLSPAERHEAESLAAELSAFGGLGQFVVDVCANWLEIDPRDQLAAVTAWQRAADLVDRENAARPPLPVPTAAGARDAPGTLLMSVST